MTDVDGKPVVEDAAKSEWRAPAGAKQGDLFVREPGVRGEPPTYRMNQDGTYRCINYPDQTSPKFSWTLNELKVHIETVRQKWEEEKRKGKKE